MREELQTELEKEESPQTPVSSCPSSSRCGAQPLLPLLPKHRRARRVTCFMPSVSRCSALATSLPGLPPLGGRAPLEAAPGSKIPDCSARGLFGASGERAS